MRLKHSAVWALVVATVAIASCRQEIQAPLGSRFEIAAGDVVRIAGTDLHVRFDHVVADSRCPLGVTCITAGEAVIVIDAGTAGPKHETLELHLPGGVAPKASATATYGSYRIRIDALEPAPVAGIRTDPSAYTATLVVER